MLFLLPLLIGAAACGSSSSDDPTARESYCISAKLDFQRVIHLAVDPLSKPRERGSARSILGLFASNGKEWVRDAPHRLVPASREILEAARSAVAGDALVLADTSLAAAFRKVGEYANRCSSG